MTDQTSTEVLEDVEEDLVEENAFLFDSPGSYIAGVRAAIEAIEQEMDDTDTAPE